MRIFNESLQNVMRNLNREVQQIQGRTVKGLLQGAIVIRRDMDTTPPVIPVASNTLRTSWFIVSSAGDIRAKNLEPFISLKSAEAQMLARRGPLVIMGFSANYAAYVHEMVDATFQRPGAGAKFFEASINRNHGAVLDVIRKEAKVKK